MFFTFPDVQTAYYMLHRTI